MGLVLDTNIPIAFANSEKDKDIMAIEKIYDLISGKKFDAFISAITISEIFAYYSKRNEKRKAVELELFLEEAGIKTIEITKKIARESGIFKAKYSISYADCIILETAIETESDIITYDPDFLKVEEIKTLKPEEFLKKKN